MSKYIDIEEIKPQLKTNFGKMLTDDQIWYIRVIANDSYSIDESELFTAILGPDMDIICKEKET